MTPSFGNATTAAGPEGTGLSHGAMAWLEKRGIDPETAARYGVCTRQHGGTGALAFPFVHDGKVVNHKYRKHPKGFAQDPDAFKTFWNADAINDAIADGKPLLITEGEMDALSAIEAGYPWAVSVPDGAPSQAGDDPIDPDEDKKFRFVWNNWERLAKVKTVILAGDGDGPGQALNHELKRRLGVERCKRVAYPDGCKDLNEVLLAHGPKRVLEVIQAAHDYPVSGLYAMADFPERAMLPRRSISMGADMDLHFRPYFGAFVVITGIPGHGKSEFADCMLVNLIRQYGVKAVVFSGEMMPRPMYRDRLRRKYLGKPSFTMTPQEIAAADRWIQENYRFIAQDVDSDDQDMTLETVLDLATIAVIRDGVRILLIDPWNELEHKRNRDETETDYIGRAIRALKRFARRYEVLVVVVAHPYKMADKGNVREPSLYDISGSSNWINKTEFGIVVWRDDVSQTITSIRIKKAKFQDFDYGQPGTVTLDYHKGSGTYQPVGALT